MTTERTKKSLTDDKKRDEKGWFGSAEGGYGTQNRYLFNGMLNRIGKESQFSLLTNGNNTNNMGVGDFGRVDIREDLAEQEEESTHLGLPERILMLGKVISLGSVVMYR